MITYAYWFALFLITALVVFGLGFKAQLWKTAATAALIIIITGWLTYAFHFEQIFVKRYGGKMEIRTPEGHIHMGITWKEDNMWIETYDPATNTCVFTEYSKGNVLQGRVFIRNCNPMLPKN